MKDLRIPQYWRDRRIPDWYTTVDLLKDPSRKFYVRESQSLAAMGVGSEVHTPESLPFRIIKMPQQTPKRGQRVVLFSMYSHSGVLTEDVRYLIKELGARRDGVFGVLATQSDGFWEKEIDPEDLSLFRALILRQNHGLDFSAFAHLLHLFPNLWDVQQITFTNDSNFGPLGLENFCRMFERIDASNSSFIGLTESFEGPGDGASYHLQSFFYAINQPALSSPEMLEFWTEKVFSFPNDQKTEIINRYERGLTQHVLKAGMSTEVLFALPGRDRRKNPSISYAAQLIADGYPFLKKSLFRFAALDQYLAAVDLPALEASFPFNLTEHVGHGHLAPRKLAVTGVAKEMQVSGNRKLLRND